MSVGPPASDPEGLGHLVRDVPDFPSPGIVFKDITPLLADGRAFASAIEALAVRVAAAGLELDRVVGIESRGFIVGAALAARIGIGFVPVRKPGKLPWTTDGESYDLEYGTDRLEIHTDAIEAGHRVLIVDDVIATGGTAAATARLVARQEADIVGFAFLAELSFLGGTALLEGRRHISLMTY